MSGHAIDCIDDVQLNIGWNESRMLWVKFDAYVQWNPFIHCTCDLILCLNQFDGDESKKVSIHWLIWMTIKSK